MLTRKSRMSSSLWLRPTLYLSIYRSRQWYMVLCIVVDRPQELRRIFSYIMWATFLACSGRDYLFGCKQQSIISSWERLNSNMVCGDGSIDGYFVYGTVCESEGYIMCSWLYRPLLFVFCIADSAWLLAKQNTLCCLAFYISWSFWSLVLFSVRGYSREKWVYANYRNDYTLNRYSHITFGNI